MSGPAYVNQQLRAVALETYFRGRLAFREAAGRVQQRVEARLPHLFVPNAKSDNALDLQPYQLRNDSQSESLALAVNQVAYVSFNYPGADAFRATALELLDLALGELGVSRLERVIYRYENEISITRDENDAIPLAKVLQVPTGPWWQGDALTEISSTWTQKAPHGRLAIRVAVEGEKPVEKLLISVISVVIPAGPVSELPLLASQAHDAARSWFEGAITSGFRDYIRGEGT